MRASDGPRRLTQLNRGECLRLLASVWLGRVVFTYQALPAIRPTCHVIDGGEIIIRGPQATAIVRDAREPGVVVAYEADALDTRARIGWSVIVTGIARRVSDPGDVARYEQMLRPWAEDDGHVIRISPEIVTGYRLGTVDFLRTV